MFKTGKWIVNSRLHITNDDFLDLSQKIKRKDYVDIQIWP